MNVTNPGIYSKKTNHQKEHISQYAGKLSDVEIGEKIGLTRSQVSYFRRYILKVQSKKTNEMISIAYDTEQVKSELEALLKFHATYSGCMMDSLEYRIKELSLKSRIA